MYPKLTIIVQRYNPSAIHVAVVDRSNTERPATQTELVGVLEVLRTLEYRGRPLFEHIWLDNDHNLSFHINVHAIATDELLEQCTRAIAGQFVAPALALAVG